MSPTLKFSSQGCCIGAVGCFILVVARLNDWHSSAGWTTSRVPRISRRRWWHTSLGCTNCGFAVNASPACLLFLLHSWHLADPSNTQRTHSTQNQHTEVRCHQHYLHLKKLSQSRLETKFTITVKFIWEQDYHH